MKALIPMAKVIRLCSRICGFLALGLLILGTQTAVGASKTPEGTIQNAMSAGPAAIANDATILDWSTEEAGKLKEVRKGANGWTCITDDPNTPANDPMCLDKMWMELLSALMNKTEPKIVAAGIGYMLQGGSSASNSDPFAPPPADRGKWMADPPHIMIVVPEKLDTTAFSSDPKSGGPWIMWGGTPYEHLMVPLKSMAK